MKRVSLITFGLIIAVVIAGAGTAYVTLAKKPSTSEMTPSNASKFSGEIETIVGDETPFSPEW